VYAHNHLTELVSEGHRQESRRHKEETHSANVGGEEVLSSFDTMTGGEGAVFAAAGERLSAAGYG